MSRTVLLVEDDRDIREPMCELLEEEGFEVVCASTGLEALEILTSDSVVNPNVILCDLMMPAMNGIELIENLRAKEHRAVRSMIILSAATNAEAMAKDLGVGFLKKPIDIDALLATVEKYCGPVN